MQNTVGPSQFGSKLRKDAPALRALGIEIREKNIRHNKRGIVIEQANEEAVIPISPSAPQECFKHPEKLGGGNNGRRILLPTVPTLPTPLFLLKKKEEDKS